MLGYGVEFFFVVFRRLRDGGWDREFSWGGFSVF